MTHILAEMGFEIVGAVVAVVAFVRCTSDHKGRDSRLAVTG